LSDFNKFEFLYKFSKHPHMLVFRPVGAALFHADGQMDRRTDEQTDRQT